MADKIKETNSSNGVAVIGFAGFTAVMLIAFFSYRGADVGQLPNLIGKLGGGPLFGFEGLRDSFAGSVIAISIVLSWFGLGSFVLSFIRITRSEEHSHLLEFAIKSGTGAAIWSLIWFLLGQAGAYIGVVAIITTVVGLVLVAISFRRVREAKRESRVPGRASGFDKALIVLIAIPVVLAFVASLAPPTAKDTLLYHFAVPKAFIAQGGSAFIEGNIASFLALGTEMHNVWAMLLGGFVGPRAAEAAAGATAFMFFPLLLLAIYGWARELKIERVWSLIAVLIVASVPTVYHVAADAYVDLALALYITLAIYIFGRWWKDQETGSLVLVGIFLGAALSIKLTALFIFAAFVLMILLRARSVKDGSGNTIRILGGGFAALVLACVIASPWYLRTWKATGSPVFPFYMNLWKGDAVGWDVERSALFQAMNSQYGAISNNGLDYLLAPYRISVVAQPEQAIFFDGVLGASFLIGLPILIWAFWKFDLAAEIRIGVGIAAIMFLFWLFSSQQLRYLLPILPALAIAIVLSAATISKKAGGLRTVWQASLTASAIAAIFVGTAWFLQKAPVRVVTGGETRDEYLARNLDYYPYYQALSTDTPADSKVWLINMRRDIYNLNRPYLSDYIFEDWTLRKMIWESRSVQELKAKTAAMGIKYVLTRHDFLFDYDKSTIVDDKRPRAENEAKLRIAKDFILDKANTVRADEKFSLIKVF